ncbi:MAG: NAD-dependent epimerase/dehydratase family protein [Euryarchaeota archaeon TMED85]|nr:MAG: hypothetical protein CMA04_004905 [Euryarchaeota archaeon]RPG73643.1 MAG: NAD-dependent epimerase/dehydratase family protein [Euryarchaeota archaeon TMED85]
MESDTVLVTGGAGFIGHHLTSALLSQGRKVRVLDDFSSGTQLPAHPLLTVIQGDMSESSVREEALHQIKSVINLAAIASVPLCESKPELSSQVNNLAAQELFKDAFRLGVSTIIQASTSALYGVPNELPLTEKSPTQPIGKYGLDKQKAEQSLLSYHQHPVCALRLFNVFGKGQKRGSPYSGVLTIFSDNISKKIPLKIFGDGTQSRDFIHINDVVSAFILCLEDLENNGIFSKVSGKKFNVCSGNSVTLLEIIESFSLFSNSEIEIIFESPREGDILHSLGSFEFLNNQIDWEPSENFIERIRELL